MFQLKNNMQHIKAWLKHNVATGYLPKSMSNFLSYVNSGMGGMTKISSSYRTSAEIFKARRFLMQEDTAPEN